jgi:hypothetical protein
VLSELEGIEGDNLAVDSLKECVGRENYCAIAECIALERMIGLF